MNWKLDNVYYYYYNLTFVPLFSLLLFATRVQAGLGGKNSHEELNNGRKIIILAPIHPPKLPFPFSSIQIPNGKAAKERERERKWSQNCFSSLSIFVSPAGERWKSLSEFQDCYITTAQQSFPKDLFSCRKTNKKWEKSVWICANILEGWEICWKRNDQLTTLPGRATENNMFESIFTD